MSARQETHRYSETHGCTCFTLKLETKIFSESFFHEINVNFSGNYADCSGFSRTEHLRAGSANCSFWRKSYAISRFSFSPQLLPFLISFPLSHLQSTLPHLPDQPAHSLCYSYRILWCILPLALPLPSLSFPLPVTPPFLRIPPEAQAAQILLHLSCADYLVGIVTV